MEVTQRIVTVRELAEGYYNDEEEGVVAYDELLNVRPPYQREFVYKDKQRDDVIRSVLAGFPLSVFYWATTPDGRFEMLDGQQRTMSICEYVDGAFSVDERGFHNLEADERQAILDYELIVYVCDGTDSEKLRWFQVINIAGEKLTDQELRNAVYSGPWVSDARRYFSKTAGAAYQLASGYMNGEPIRQAYLETVIGWAADRDGAKSVNAYMAAHQHDADATPLWNYFRKVVRWVEKIFPTYYKQMKGLNWGELYNRYHEAHDGSEPLGDRVAELMADEEVTSKRGIFEYVLGGDESKLSIRTFDESVRVEAYERQGHRCAICGKEMDLKDMHADHIEPWSRGGRTVPENCQMLCTTCNLKKSSGV